MNDAKFGAVEIEPPFIKSSYIDATAVPLHCRKILLQLDSMRFDRWNEKSRRSGKRLPLNFSSVDTPLDAGLTAFNIARTTIDKSVEKLGAKSNGSNAAENGIGNSKFGLIVLPFEIVAIDEGSSDVFMSEHHLNVLDGDSGAERIGGGRMSAGVASYARGINADIAEGGFGDAADGSRIESAIAV